MDPILITQNFISKNDINSLYDFILNNQIDKRSLEEIFSLIYDHTNSFKNYNTNSTILKIASELLKKGVKHDKIILEKTKKSFGKMKLIGEIIKDIKKDGSQLKCIFLEDLLYKYQENENILDFISNNILFSIKDINKVIFEIHGTNGIKIIEKFKNN